MLKFLLKTWNNWSHSFPANFDFPSLCTITRPQGHSDYLRSGNLSPWVVVDGWHIKSCFHDPMHVVFLGICRDLYSSSLGYWMRNDYFGDGPLHSRLHQFSNKMREACRRERCLNHLHSTHVSKFHGGKFSQPPWIHHKWNATWSTKKDFWGFGYISEKVNFSHYIYSKYVLLFCSRFDSDPKIQYEQDPAVEDQSGFQTIHPIKHWIGQGLPISWT